MGDSERGHTEEAPTTFAQLRDTWRWLDWSEKYKLLTDALPESSDFGIPAGDERLQLLDLLQKIGKEG